jgi:hypothetical protein
MRHGLRALTIACTTTLVAAGALIGIAAPSGAQEVTASDCGSKTYRWLFWPEGHGDLKSVPHPATDIPHLDVYSGKGKKFLDAQNVAYADGTSVTTGATCTPVELPAGGSASVKSSFGQAKQLVCKSPSMPVFVAVPESTVDFPSLSALVDDKLVANAQLGSSADTASTLDYDGKVCKLKKPPK